MVYSIFEVGSWIQKYLSALAPATIVIIVIIVTAAMTRGYRNLIQGVVDITKSKWSTLFFLICVGIGLYFWFELKAKIGW
jgi:succinate dehydrogenase hydrophobic anchor subunit